MEIKLYNEYKQWFYRVKRKDEKLENEDFYKKFNFSKEDFIELNPDFVKLTAGRVLTMPPSSKYYHIVGPLESYERIAKLYNCKIDHLKQLNKVNYIFIGQRIFI